MPQIREKNIAPNPIKSFNITLNENTLTDENLFMANIISDKVKKHKKPDADFYRAITMDELLEGVLEDIHTFYANK